MKRSRLRKQGSLMIGMRYCEKCGKETTHKWSKKKPTPICMRHY